MGKHNRCCVGPCDNDKRYPEKYIIHSNVTSRKIVFHKFPTNEQNRKLWTSQVLRGRKDWVPGNYTYVCSNHFINGKPTSNNPVPTLFMSGPANATNPTKYLRKPPTKRQKLELNEQKPSCSRELDPVPVDIEPDSDIEDYLLSKEV